MRFLLALAAATSVIGCRQAPAPARDWSPDSISDAYRPSVAAILWPGATRAFLATSAGELYNGAWRLRFDAASGADRAGPARTVACEDRWCPVVRWTRWSGPVRWDFEAVAVPEQSPPVLSARGPLARFVAGLDRDRDRRLVDAAVSGSSPASSDGLRARMRRPMPREGIDRANFFVSLRVVAVNHGAAARGVTWRMGCSRPGAAAAFADADSGIAVPWSHCWSAGASADSVIGWGPGRHESSDLSDSTRLGAGERRELRFVLSAYPVEAHELERVRRLPHEECVAATRSYWTVELSRGAQFDLPDREAVEAIRASEVLLLQLRERRATDWVPIGNPFQYRDVWLRDGARAAQALAVMGFTRESRELARSFLGFQWPQGQFVSQTGQLDGSGQALWAFEQTLLRPGPDPDVRRFAESALKAWRALERERVKPGAAARGRVPGLLPATDPHDAELTFGQLVGNDAWAITGYRSAERLLRAAQMSAQAESVASSRRGYVADFESALARLAIADIPPSWTGQGSDWGNLAVGYPCMALPPQDARLSALARRYWAPLGGAGLGCYRDPNALHTYVAMDLGSWALLDGRAATADSVLEAALTWRSASGGAAEIFDRRSRGFGANLPPHATAAAALLELIRNSVIFDDNDTLQLTLGARPTWWGGAAVRRAPTRWGLVDLEFERRGPQAQWRWSAVPVWTELTLPPGCVLDGTPPAPLRAGLRPRTVLAPPGTRAVSVAIEEARSATAGAAVTASVTSPNP